MDRIKEFMDYPNRPNLNNVRLKFLHNRENKVITYVKIVLIDKKDSESEEKLFYTVLDIDKMNALDEPVKLNKSGDRYQIVSGINRVIACEILGYTEIPAILI